MFFFFFNDTATTEIYTLSLHDALPISTNGLLEILAAKGLPARASELKLRVGEGVTGWVARTGKPARIGDINRDRKSTRLNSSHLVISYAVFCLKKKNIEQNSRSFILHS